MAKITSVELLKVPKHINVGDDISDITVLTTIAFHPLDQKLQMEYCLHVFVYDIHGDMDAPLIIPNWDESDVLPICMGRKDDFLGKVVTFFDAKKKEVVIENDMALKLGKFNRELSYTSRKLEVFASITPAIGRASKYSKPFTSNLSY